MRVIPVDNHGIEEVREAIENLTAPMESGVREVLTDEQRTLLYRLRTQLGNWMDSH